MDIKIFWATLTKSGVRPVIWLCRLPSGALRSGPALKGGHPDKISSARIVLPRHHQWLPAIDRWVISCSYPKGQQRTPMELQVSMGSNHHLFSGNSQAC
ncbi:hypothetical protein EVAR_18701_1 [Eumeta japonica]|uniref:Uncharacterized protein n=1 Tax=Eumeta variegata TaxID=151549 RepID=A0A4C1U724_EUMVA|nr:hypothetical protein EVAR_18701_1 [Eumeta japonica]